MSFVKLDCGILNSTLWVSKGPRDVFITALLMAEPREFLEEVPQIHVRRLEKTGWIAPAGWYGFVPAAGPGIVRMSMCDQEEGIAALEILGLPEPESRSQAFDGRRLIRIDGGYIVLNYMLYRDRDYTGAERSRRYRERQKAKSSHRDVITSHRDITQAEAEAEKYKTPAPSVLVDTASRNPPPEQVETGKPSKAYRVPACPAQEIIDMFHATLPTLPHADVLNDARRRAIGARWRDVCAETKMTRQDGMAWFAWFFGRVSESGWLMGRVKGLRGDVFTQCTIDFLMAPTKFTKVIEGFYHRDQKQA